MTDDDLAMVALAALVSVACYFFGVPLEVNMVAALIATLVARPIKDRGRAP